MPNKFKKRISLLFLLCYSVLLMSSTAAQQSAVDVRLSELGAYIPEEIDAFLAVRTGATYLDDLDAITLSLTERIADDVLPTQTLRDLLDQIIAPEINGISLVRFVDLWVGDESAIGVDNLAVLLDDNPDNDTDAIIHMAVRITNRALARGAVATLGLTTDSIRSENGDFTIFTNEAMPNSIALNDDLMLITLNTTTSALGVPSLADETDFQAALQELPPQSHLAIFYARATQTVQDLAQDRAVQDILTALRLNADSLGGLAIGFSLADNRSVLVDAIQLRTLSDPPINQPIDITFASSLPASTAFVLHTTDLATLVDSASGLIAAISASDTPAEIYQRLEVLSSLLLGLDLQSQVLDVANGDFAILVNVDESTTPPQGNIGATFKLGATQGADALSEGIGFAATQLFETAIVAPTILQNTTVPLNALSITIPNPTPADIIVTHQDDLFFLATSPLITTLVEASPTLAEDSTYQEALQYILPDAHIALFVNQQGPGALIDFGVAVLEPLGTFLSEDALQPDDIATLRDVLTVVLNSGSVSTLTNENGHLLVRFVITLAT